MWDDGRDERGTMATTLIQATDHTKAELLRAMSWQRLHEYSFIPSERPLYQILLDVTDHPKEYPTHGLCCSCMDRYSYEIRRHITRAVPDVTKIWHDPAPEVGEFDPYFTYDKEEYTRMMDAKTRIHHVLYMVMRAV